jgi:tetratricopeptide (TPR) repeat protein
MSPQNVQSLFAAAVTHYRAGRLQDAGLACRQVLYQDPQHVDCTKLLAVIAWQQGRLDEALAGFDAMVRLVPTAESHFQRANVLKALGRRDEAITAFDAALDRNPAFAEAHLNKGNSLLDAGRAEAALVSFAAALKAKPSYVAALNNTGNALLALGRPREALAYYDSALAAQPDLAQAHHNRANALQALERLEEAVAGYDHAIGLKPDYAEALCNKGNALQKMGAFLDAVTWYDQALTLEPDHAEALANRGNAFANLGRDPQALADCRRVAELRPDWPDARYRLAVALLRMGNLRDGWPLFEARKVTVPPGSYRGGTPWLGDESIAGQTLLVDAEQGLGDTLQFCRYLWALKQTGANIVFSVQDSLVRLLHRAFPDVRIVPASGPPPAFDRHVPLLSLPLALQMNNATTNNVPYLSAEPDRIDKWRNHLAGPHLKIGIAWQGNRKSAADVGRSFGVEMFAQIAKLPGVRLICLQKDQGDLPSTLGIETLGPDFDAGPQAFLDTSAVMEVCDLIITADTAIAHLAGALGRSTWVALRHWPDWRWFTGRPDSPWYPSMTLFRQCVPGDWAQVFADMANRLVTRMGNWHEAP